VNNGWNHFGHDVSEVVSSYMSESLSEVSDSRRFEHAAMSKACPNHVRTSFGHTTPLFKRGWCPIGDLRIEVNEVA